MNTVEISFAGVADFLADFLAKNYPKFSVGRMWPSGRESPERWMVVRDDGTVKTSVVTGVFSGAVIVRAPSSVEMAQVASQVLSHVLHCQYERGTPVVAIERQSEPYFIEDATYGHLIVLNLELVVLGKEMELTHGESSED